MPVVNCPSCGAVTNTAVCPGWWDDRRQAKCAGKFVDGKWQKGCGYEDAGHFDRSFVDGLLADNDTQERRP